MSKYDALWACVQRDGSQTLKLTFGQIQEITGIPIDHSFLRYGKELTDYGDQVGKISMKEQTVVFHRLVQMPGLCYNESRKSGFVGLIL